MSENSPQNTEQKDCTATPPPTGETPKCDPLPAPPDTPTLPEPKECEQLCCCPTPPGSSTNCLDTLIKSQSELVKKADREKELVAELTDIQSKAASAQLEYTQTRYKDLLKIWQDQDKAIVDLVQKLVCAVPCWWCLLECRLCSELNAIRALERQVNGTGELTTEVFSLIDLEFWQTRNVASMQARVDRIKSVLAAWEKPSQTLGDALDKNAKLIEDTQKIIATDSAKAIFDVFMRLLPMHWAIRPRGGTVVSKIDAKFIDICKCDDGEPDDCCGPDVGVMSLRFRLLGPQPYLIDPAEFFGIICCLAKERLLPASNMLATATAELATTTADIARVEALIEEKTNSIETSFTAELGNPIDCEKYTRKGNGTNPPAPCGSTQTAPAAR
jgi:hypothetical protein